MSPSTATDRGGHGSGDAVDAVLHALAALDDAGVRAVIRNGWRDWTTPAGWASPTAWSARSAIRPR